MLEIVNWNGANEPVVLEYLTHENNLKYHREHLEFGDASDMVANVIRMAGESCHCGGEVMEDQYFPYTNLRYHTGCLRWKETPLKYISWHLKDELDVAGVLHYINGFLAADSFRDSLFPNSYIKEKDIIKQVYNEMGKWLRD